MDDVDRELKQIQLQRERLALARELAESQKMNLLNAAGAALVSGKSAVFAAISRFIAKRGKTILVVALVGASLGGGLMFREYYLDTKLAMASELYATERNKFVEERCEDARCNTPYLGFEEEISCSRKNFERPTCARAAGEAFFQLKGAPPSR